MLLPSGLVLLAGGLGSGGNPDPQLGTLQSLSTGTFSSGPALACDECSSTLLANGQVLFAGGIVSGPSGTAEIYNSSSNTASATGGLNVARYGHTGTLLANGDVLIAGGATASGLAATAELYDPGAGIFTLASALNDPRFGHTASLLNTGDVLIAGATADQSVELYDPGSGLFTTRTALMSAPRTWQTQTTLSNGQVLVAGGISCVGTQCTTYSSAELFDPATGKFTLTGSMNSARQGHTATLLNDGTVLITGGLGGSTAPTLDTAELYNPVSATFSQLANSLNSARAFHTATLLANGKVLLAGGQGGGSAAEIYDPVAQTFSLTGSMNVARFQQTATLLATGGVLMAGGYSSPPVISPQFQSSVEIYNVATGTFGSLQSMPGNGPLSSASLLGNGQVLLAEQDPILFNPAGGTFTSVPLGSISYLPAQEVSALLPNGQVLLAGGGVNTSAYLYDPVANALTAINNIPTSRLDEETAAPLANGNILIVGGEDAAGTQALASADVYQYQPPATVVATVTSVTPNPLTGFNAVPLTVEGTNFLPAAVVSFDGTALATTYVSGAELTATVPASELTAVGSHQVTVTNSGGSPSSPFAVSIQNPSIQLSPGASPLNFGSANLDSVTAAQSATVTAGGNAALVLGAITINGTNPGDFVIGNASTCPLNGGTLQPAASCIVQVTFAPTATGARSAQLSIPNNATPSVATLSLVGSGTDPGLAITSVLPASATTGSAALAVTVSGTNFVSN